MVEGSGGPATEQTVEATLDSGERLILRPLATEDRELVKTLFAQLSDRSRRLRFLDANHFVTEEELSFLTEPDGVNHCAWAAMLVGEKRCIGVARWVRWKKTPAMAELAVTVMDSYQNCGVGELLLTHVVREAAKANVRVMVAWVAADNAAVLHLAEKHCARRTSAEPGVFRIEVAVPSDASGVRPPELTSSPALEWTT